MGLAHKPHTITITPKSATDVGTERTGYADGETAQISGQLTEKTPSEALERYGLDLRFPAIFLCDLDDADSLQVGYKFTLNSRTYFVQAGPKRMDAETLTEHALYVVDRKSE